MSVPSRPGGRILVDQLRVHGADLAFCVPGESYLAVLDALYDARDAIRLIVARQDGGAAYMAEAYGKLTGRPGICFVTRGPGATNAAIAVHTAQQDSTPMILFIGQVGSDFVEREAFQEIDYRRMFGSIAKWVASIDRADRIPELVSHAFHVAMSGRRGPVVLALPEDMLVQTAAVPDAVPYKVVQSHPGAGDIAALRSLLAAAERPLVMPGGSGWTQQAVADLQTFADANDLPVGCAFRFQDVFDNRHPNYAGDVGIGLNPKLAQRVKDADLVLALGPRLGEMTTGGYTLLTAPRPTQKLVHVHAGAEELGRVYQADVMINAGAAPMAAALAAMTPVEPRWREWTGAANADYRANIEAAPMAGPLDYGRIVCALRDLLPRDTIVATGAGNYTGWVHRYWQHSVFRTQLSPTSGAMGYGVPAAVAAKLAAPHRTVLSFNGDGCFLMNGQELATAAQYDARVIFLVVNNGSYGTIRMHQERDYPARVYATSLVNPDFAALARAYGLHGERVERTADFMPAFERCQASGKASLIEVVLDTDLITTRTTLAEVRSRALKAAPRA
jgi:acetolactate synthase-1/2/3 large subunit